MSLHVCCRTGAHEGLGALAVRQREVVGAKAARSKESSFFQIQRAFQCWARVPVGAGAFKHCCDLPLPFPIPREPPPATLLN